MALWQEINSFLRKQCVQCLEIDDKSLVLIKRNKALRQGDFQIPVACLQNRRPNKSVDTVTQQSDQLQLQAQSRTQPQAKLKEWAWPEDENVKVTHTANDKNNLYIKIDRRKIYKTIIEDICCKHYANENDESHISGNHVLINSTAFVQNDESEVSLQQIRTLIVEEHLTKLLESSCCRYRITKPVYQRSEHQKATLQDLNLLRGELLPLDHTELKQEQRNILQTLTHCPFLKNEQRNIAKKPSESKKDTVTCESQHICKDVSVEASIKKSKCDAVTLDLHHYLQHSKLEIGKKGYDKNLHIAQYMEDSWVLTQMAAIQQQQRKHNNFTAHIHIVGQECDFRQQQVELGMRIISPNLPPQIRLVHGPVFIKGSTGDTPPSAKEFFRLKREEMREAFAVRYGAQMSVPGWEDTVSQVTEAAIRFNILLTSVRSPVKLCITEEEFTTSPKGGIFVLYNCARLATLFSHHQQAVDAGTYPSLPNVEDVDFSLLREEEWELVFNHLLVYDSVVHDCVRDILHGKPHPTIHTHKICQFLMDLSLDLSSYYSRVHILGEPRPHLYPLMFARLYLLKAVHSVMQSALHLLNITPMSQL